MIFPKLFVGGFIYESTADNLTALAGGGLHAGTPVLAAKINRFTTVGTTGDSTALPPAVGLDGGAGPQMGGISLRVLNSGAQTLDVYPQAGDTINGSSSPATIAANSSSVFYCVSKGAWFNQ